MSNTYVNDRQTDDVENPETTTIIRVKSPMQLALGDGGAVIVLEGGHQTVLLLESADVAYDLVLTATHAYGDLCVRELEALR
jgi:hypothetical protein